MTFEVYVWKSPRPADADEAEALLRAWSDAGGGKPVAGEADTSEIDPSRSPFEPSDDVRWFSRELSGDFPPVWSPDRPAKREHPDRLVVMPFEQEAASELLGEVYGIAAKYDLIVYDPQRRSVHQPLADMAAYASATFWPRGAIQAAVAGAGGAVLAVAGWFLGIPILSGVGIVIGLFLVVMAIFTFVHQGGVALRSRRSG
jgi:hypothetical protein